MDKREPVQLFLDDKLVIGDLQQFVINGLKIACNMFDANAETSEMLETAYISGLSDGLYAYQRAVV